MPDLVSSNWRQTWADPVGTGKLLQSLDRDPRQSLNSAIFQEKLGKYYKCTWKYVAKFHFWLSRMPTRHNAYNGPVVLQRVIAKTKKVVTFQKHDIITFFFQEKCIKNILILFESMRPWRDVVLEAKNARNKIQICCYNSRQPLECRLWHQIRCNADFKSPTKVIRVLEMTAANPAIIPWLLSPLVCSLLLSPQRSVYTTDIQ